MTPNPYNLSQWHWIADRLDEGYKMREMVEFVGMRQKDVRYNLIAIGRRLEPEDRVPLNERKQEFCAMADDGSPRVNHYYVPVIGTDKDGNTVRFDSARDAERALGIPYNQVGRAAKCNTMCHGYKWERENKE